jgi:hypothetical protein
MVVSNFVFGSNTLKFDDVIGVILSEKIHKKSSGSTSTSCSVLNVERRGISKEREKNLKVMGTHEENQRTICSNPKKGKIVGTVVSRVI